MTRLARIGLVIGLSVVLLGAAAIGVLPRLDREPAAAPAPVPDQGSLLAPGVGLGATVTALQQRLHVMPSDWQAQAALGLAYVQEGRITADPSYYPKAEGILQASLQTKPAENADAFVGLAALSAARHDFSGALQFGNQARTIEPYNANVRGVIGDALIELGRYDDAFTAYQSMMDIRPDTASYARVSYARELLGDVPGATLAMRQAQTFAGTASDRAWTSYQLGELYFNEGRLGPAERAYRAGTELDPTYVPSFAGLAKVAWARGDLSGAIAKYTDVVARYPSPEYVIALGDLYSLTGDRTSAERQYALVHVEIKLFRANGVDTDLELSLFDSDHGDPGAGLVAARTEWGRRHSVHVADAFGWALYRNGRYASAAVYSRRALKLGTHSALFMYHAGMIQLALGNDAAGKTMLRRAFATNPNFSILGVPEARRALVRVGDGR